MVTLAGWLTRTQVAPEVIEQTLESMAVVLADHAANGSTAENEALTRQPARFVQPGAGVLVFSDPTYTAGASEPDVLDWTPERRTMVYRRPLTGTHPLYYCENWPAEGNLVFASDPRALLALGVPRRLHLAALDALLHYGFLPAPWTLFRDIQCVPAGSILRWQHTKLVVNPSTDFQLTSPNQPEEQLEQLSSLLEKTIINLLPQEGLQGVTLLHDTAASYYLSGLLAQYQPACGMLASLQPQSEDFAQAAGLPLLLIEGKSQPEYWIAPLLTLATPTIDGRALRCQQLLHTATMETGAHVALSSLGASNLVHRPVPLTIRQQRDYAPIWSHRSIQHLQQEETWEETAHARKLLHKAEQISDPQQRTDYLALHLRLPDQEVAPALRLANEENLSLRSPFLALPVMRLLTALPRQLPDGMTRAKFLSNILERISPELTQQAKLHAREANVEPDLSGLFEQQDHELLRLVLSPEALEETGLFEAKVIQELMQATTRAHRNPPASLILAFTTQLLCQQFGLETGE
ncbi:MAG TPA: hypothetical protein VFN23_04495 [Ktedonobacteraceae bacterium]|nr:hypothetical protein [Ktedonobacteraceae bacterium]